MGQLEGLMTQTVSDSNNSTAFYENGERVFPCRCGEVHRGDNAHWDWIHHECLHSGRLWALEEIAGIKQFLCVDCGMLFQQVDEVKS